MVLGGFRSFHVLALTRQLDHFFFFTNHLLCLYFWRWRPPIQEAISSLKSKHNSASELWISPSLKSGSPFVIIGSSESIYTSNNRCKRNYRATKCLQTTLQLNTARHNYEYEVVQQHYTKFLQHNKTRHKTQHNGYLNASTSQFENFRNTWRLRKNPPFRKSCLHNASSV